MIAVEQGGLPNSAKLAQNLSVSSQSITRYLAAPQTGELVNISLAAPSILWRKTSPNLTNKSKSPRFNVANCAPEFIAVAATKQSGNDRLRRPV